MDEKEIRILSAKFLAGKTTPEEEVRFHEWYDSKGYLGERVVVKTDGEDREAVGNRLFIAIRASIEKKVETKPSRLNRTKPWMVAAAIFLLLTVGTYIYVNHSTIEKAETHYTKLLKNDVEAGGDHAVLELENGETIYLNEVDVGYSATMNGMKVKKMANDVLQIEALDTPATTEPRYSTVRTPKGGQYQLQLPDGTRVWLNAASAIRFPDVFSEQTRTVDLAGEAYFEVVNRYNQQQQPIPFMVTTQQQEVEVLGTHFNINSYANEEVTRTTLLEGSVRVKPHGAVQGQLLTPGQQSSVRGHEVAIEVVDTETAVAWKNGDFIFDREGLQSIMNKLERWYDVEVIYQGALHDYTFSGAISRSKNLSEVLQIMEMSGKVTFRIEGRRVFVKT